MSFRDKYSQILAGEQSQDIASGNFKQKYSKELGTSEPTVADDFWAGVAGLNNTVENIPRNILSVTGLDKTPFGNWYSKGLNQIKQDREADMQRSPVGAGVGALTGNLLTAAPTIPFGGTLSAGLGGALTGYLTSDSDQSQANKLINAGIGGVLGAGLQGASNIIGTTFQGAKYAVRDPKELAETALNNTLDQVGLGLSDVTPASYFKSLDDMKINLMHSKNRMYTKRNDLANEAKIVVDRPNTNKFFNDISNLTEEGAGLAKKTILNQAGDFLGTANKGTSVENMYDLIKDVTSKIRSTEDGNLASLYRKLRDSLGQDVNDAITASGNPKIIDLNNLANKTNAEYSTLRNFDNKYQFAKHYANTEFMGAIKKLYSDKEFMKSFGADTGNDLMAAYSKAMMDSSLKDNLFDASSFIRSLNNAQKDTKIYDPFKDKLGSLVDALKVSREFQDMGKSISQHSAGQKIMMTLGALGGSGPGGLPGAIAGGAMGYYLPKSAFLYGAGKLLKNQNTRSLLDKAAMFVPGVSPIIKERVYNKIADQFMRVLSKIPQSEVQYFMGEQGVDNDR